MRTPLMSGSQHNTTGFSGWGDAHRRRKQSQQQCLPAPTLIKRLASVKEAVHTEQPTWSSKPNENNIIRRSGLSTKVKERHTGFQCKQSDSSQRRSRTSLWHDCSQFLIHSLQTKLEHTNLDHVRTQTID